MKVQKIQLTLTLLILAFFTVYGHASGMNDATWYVSIDVDKVQKNEIYQLLHDKKQQSSSKETVGLSHIPEEISHITLYGDAKGSKDATAVIRGDFRNFSLDQHLLTLLYAHEDASKMFKESELSYKTHGIKVLTFTENYQGDHDKEDEVKNVYLSKINNQLSVVSFNQSEVKNWLDEVYTDTTVTKGRLLSVEVNVETALAHMGLNLEDNSHSMHSEIFKKVLQVSASITEENNGITIDVALTTIDDAAAVQIEQVINGLVAMKNLSGHDGNTKLHESFIENLIIERSNNVILISTYTTLENVKKADFIQDTIQEK